MLAQHPLQALFNPSVVAVIGASTNPQKAGNRICRQLLAEGFPGTLVPVNARGESVLGLPSVRRVSESPTKVDVAVIVTATEKVREAIKDCAASGVKFAVIHTAGFGETGPEGRAQEQELVAIAREAGMRIVGPNCMQMYNAKTKLNLIGTPFPSGRIGVISQSGNLIRALTEEFEASAQGFSKFVTVGNQADLAFDEYLDFLAQDTDTDAIFLYVEGFLPGAGRRFMEVASRVVRAKPVVLFKGGRSKAGSRSTISHTGSLAGERRVVEAALRQAGVILAERFDEVPTILAALVGLPRPRGRRIAVIGGGGGHATLCADALEQCGLEVPELTPAARAKIAALLPDRAATANPVDFTGGSEREIAVYAKVPEIALKDGISGCLLYGLYAGYRTDLERPGNTYLETSQMIVDIVRRYQKPIIMQTVYARRPHPSIHALRAGGVPVTDSVECAARSLAALCTYASYRSRPQAAAREIHGPSIPPDLLSAARRRACRNLTEAEAMKAVALAGLPTVPFRLASTKTEAIAAAEAIGFPVVAKIHDPNFTHKSETGGVFLDLQDAQGVAAAFDKIVAISSGAQAIIAQQVEAGQEVIIGAFRDPCFGPVVMFGIGGILVEVIQDIAFRIAPISESDAHEMIEEIRAVKLLGAYRGRSARDRQAIIDIIRKVSDLMVANPEIAEIDLNPVISLADGALIVDARIILAQD